jgi:hypothetical protein
MKRFAAALTVSTAVLAFAPVPLTAQGRSQAGQGTTAQTPPVPGQINPYAEANLSAENIKQSFQEVLQRYPRSVPRILRLDPRLMNDANYMANYPAIQQFIAQFPDVARNPDYYLSEYAYNYIADPYMNRTAQDRAIDMMRNWVEMFMVLLIAVTVSIAVLWLLKSLIDHRRWLRISKIQTEVHTKLLDRFGTSEELLSYMKTPAGARFLESAPISLDAGASKHSASAPVSRILWSVQAGIVIFLGGAAFLVARTWFEGQELEEVRTMLAMIGTFATFIGIGFIVSAGAAWVLSRRLGLMEGTRAPSSSSVSQ